MATKLKRYNIILKTAAFVIPVVVCSFLILYFLRILPEVNYIKSWRDLNKTEFTETSMFYNDRSQVDDAVRVLYTYRSEQLISQGTFVTKKYVEDAKSELLSYVENDVVNQLELQFGKNLTFSKKTILEYFEIYYEEEIANIENQIIQTQLLNFRNASNFLIKKPEIVYYINTNDMVISNTAMDYNSILINTRQNYIEYMSNDGEHERYIFAYTNAFIDKMNTNLNNEHTTATNFVYFVVAGAVVILICLIYIIYAAGRKSTESKKIRMFFIDRLYSEFTVGFILLSIFLVFGFSLLLYDSLFLPWLCIAGLVICIALTYWLFLMLIRHMKNKTFFKSFLIIILLSKTFNDLHEMYSLKSPLVKTMIIATLLGVLTMIPFMGIITIPLGVWFASSRVEAFKKLVEGINTVKKGEYNGKIEIPGKSEFAKLANDINEITAGLADEVERRTKSERLKTELIVNVSHDIKTPLTSIITYADLLQKEKTDNENIINYIDIIAKKSERLRTMIDDLFESSKAASGNLNVNLEKVDITELIAQALGEFDERIDESSLDFKVSLPKERVYAKADGQLLWRVLENLFSNVLKYSLENSRVYIDVTADSYEVFIEIKNISSAELLIPDDEFTERFKRGDESRSSDGSGLGLDIAKSLMLCQNGQLTIHSDGDLFKVRLYLQRCIIEEIDEAVEIKKASEFEEIENVIEVKEINEEIDTAIEENGEEETDTVIEETEED